MLWLALVSVVLADSLLWGPYRPNLYFGMRPQLPESVLTGLMWFRANSISGVSNMRHTVGNGDSVSKFGWEAYDARLGGRQRIQDTGNAVNLTTDLVKSSDGTAWEVRIRGDQSPDNVLTLVYYAGLESVPPANGGRNSGREDFHLSLPTQRKLTSKGIKAGEDVVLAGSSDALGGKFKLTVGYGEGDRPAHSHEAAQLKPSTFTQYTNLYVPAGEQWQAQQIYMTLIQDEVSTFLDKYGEEETDVPVWSILAPNNDASFKGNMHFIQQSFQGPFEFRVKFVPKDAEADFEDGEMADFEAKLDEVLSSQQQRFDQSLALQAPYTDSAEYYDFAREMISDVAGGVGYFYGDSRLRAREGDEGEEVATGVLRVPPHELFSGTPSRAFFPRGFYWDEGFNALALMPYDEDLVLRILRSWFNTMDEDGYIQREQILGGEGRSLVPEEFQVQDRSIANPPTLVMALAHLADHHSEANALLREFYPQLQTHFEWFRRTQRGETISYDRQYQSNEVYRWRGRTRTHILASGLDDYPRAPEPSDGELHVDLQAWIGAMAHSLVEIANRLGNAKDAAYYESIYSRVQQNLEDVFWDEEHGAYCDVAIDEYEEDAHVCHLGYVTHLPFMLKLVPESSTERLVTTMSHLRNPEELWSVGGIRSLSRSDEFFGTGENYWRGAVWNNMNYLTLDSLLHYARSTSVDQQVRLMADKIYGELRTNVVANIYKHYKETGYVWESYKALSGEPKGAKAFTGWAALVANIMAMPESTGAQEQIEEARAHASAAAAAAEASAISIAAAESSSASESADAAEASAASESVAAESAAQSAAETESATVSYESTEPVNEEHDEL